MLGRFATFMMVLTLASLVAAGEAREKKTFAHRYGGMEVTALLNRRGEGNSKLLIGAGEDDLERAAKPGAMANSVNAFLVKMNNRTILFDTGLPAGPDGSIVDALAEAGIAPAAIDAIVITHFHRDHVGGLLDKDGKPVYPRAELFLPRCEVDKWSDSGTEFIPAYNVRTNAFEYGKEILPGVTAIAATGHTPGHTIFQLASGDGKLLIIGDLIHFPGVQLVNPDIAVTYDTDPVKAVAARKEAFDRAAQEKLPVAGMHIPFPGLGLLAKDGSGYVFTPVQ